MKMPLYCLLCTFGSGTFGAGGPDACQERMLLNVRAAMRLSPTFVSGAFAVGGPEAWQERIPFNVALSVH